MEAHGLRDREQDMDENPFVSEPTGDLEGYMAVEDDTSRDEDRWYPGKYTRRFLFAGLGAVASAIDTAGETFDRFADRGERLSEDWNERVEDMRNQNADAGDRVRDYARSGVNSFLDTLGVPNKGDVDTINVKLNILSRKLDDLQLDRVPPSSEVPPASPQSSVDDITI
jgi:polyhydroxyalkanoate synthesis regulator phasin